MLIVVLANGPTATHPEESLVERMEVTGNRCNSPPPVLPGIVIGVLTGNVTLELTSAIYGPLP
jgi:hypothetical protein